MDLLNHIYVIKIDDKIRENYIMQSLFQLIYPIMFASIHFLLCKILNGSHCYRNFNPGLSVVYCFVCDKKKKSRTSEFDNPCNSLALSMGQQQKDIFNESHEDFIAHLEGFNSEHSIVLPARMRPVV